MKKVILSFLLPVMAFASCSADELPDSGIVDDKLDNDTKTLIAYFSAEGHTKVLAEAIQKETGADIFFIEPAVPYADNPYDDSDKIQNEAYNDLRPEVRNYLTEEQMAKYDTIFVGTPCWWHQPAMVVCTFLEHYNLSEKVIIPFVTYGATTYLNETMQKLYKCTLNSVHIPAELPEDIDPDNIRQPQNDDYCIDMPTVRTVRQWLERIGYGRGGASVSYVTPDMQQITHGIYNLQGMRLAKAPEYGQYIMNGEYTQTDKPNYYEIHSITINNNNFVDNELNKNIFTGNIRLFKKSFRTRLCRCYH